LLAQASGAIIDFVVRPTLDALLIGGGGTVNPLGTPIPNADNTGSIRSISVTKAQIAPYAERRKAAGSGGGSGSRNNSGSNGNSEPPIRRRPVTNTFGPPPPLPTSNTNSNVGNNSTGGPFVPPPVPSSPRYDIPIYADGRTIRVETVRRPQE
jgi:hypothetical protein